jgi:flavin-dependent dehydrogenase
VASRTAFDGALLAAAVRAGARHVPERVVDVEVGAGGARLRTAPARTAAPGPRGAPAAGAHTWRAGWVLGADGANSLVRRRLGRPFARGDLSIGTGVFARGVTGDRIAVALVADPPGYLWAFPRPDHLAVGIGAQADAGATSAALRARAAAWLRRSGWAPPGAPLEPYAWPIPSLDVASLDAERPTGPGWLLLGDAAGLVDPLTREGIYFALLSGVLAADALAGPDPGGRYRERLGDEVYPELRRAAALRDGFFRPAFARLLLEALARSARIRGIMADLVGGRQPYRGLRRRLLATREVGLALRLLALYLVPKSRSPASPRPGTM